MLPAQTAQLVKPLSNAADQRRRVSGHPLHSAHQSQAGRRRNALRQTQYLCRSPVLHLCRETGDALAYRAQAQRIEEELMSVLKHRQLETSELVFLASPSQGAWNVLHDLCEDTQTALASHPAVPEEECIVGILRSTDGRKVRFTEFGPGGRGP